MLLAAVLPRPTTLFLHRVNAFAIDVVVASSRPNAIGAIQRFRPQSSIFEKTSSDEHGEKVNGEGTEYQNESSIANNNPTTTTQRSSASLLPLTGWNHNLPREASDFWNGPRDEKTSPKPQQSSQPQSAVDSASAPLRTGWLHNSKKASSVTIEASKTATAIGDTPPVMFAARRLLAQAKLQKERNHRLLHPPTFHAGGEDNVVAVTEHLVSVPLVYDKNNEMGDDTNSVSSKSRTDVYFCIVEKVDSEDKRLFYQNQLGTATSLTPTQRAQKYVEYASLANADSMVLFLQGGPGFGAPVPGVGVSLAKGSGSWADAALHTHNYQRIVLLDQRGTGKSTPITKQSLELQFPDLFLLDSQSMERNSRSLYTSNNAAAAADDDDKDNSEWDPSEKERVTTAVNEACEFLSHFRADNIVQDAEYIREALLLPAALDRESRKPDESTSSSTVNAFSRPLQGRPWGCSLGQSYGGFCQMTYLSRVEYPPKVMLFTGGIAPMLSNVEQVYGELWDRVKERNLRYYDMFPGDIPLVKLIVQKLLNEPMNLPSGGRLTARRFLSLGISLGGSPSSFASLHELIATAFVGGSFVAIQQQQQPEATDLVFSRSFLKQVDAQQSFDDHPLYFWLHESIYADGPNHSPTQWAADRAYQTKLAGEKENSDVDYRRTSSQSNDNGQPTLFFGEHVFPWMTEDFSGLSGVGLGALAQALATKRDWGPLFDATRMKRALGDGRTRAAAAVYHEDMYVEFQACMKVTARGGPMEQCKLWVTNEYQHSGLRDGGATLFSKLHGMAKGGTRTPS